jgi:hypothetical protein
MLLMGVFERRNGYSFDVRTVPKKKNNSMALVCEQTIPTERPPLVRKLVPIFAYRGCRVVKATYPHGRILDFLDQYSERKLYSSEIGAV